MPIGPGKYDDLCTYVRTTANAKSALLIIIGGNLGHGFSMQTADPSVLFGMAGMLRDVAQQIEDSLRAGKI